MSHPGLEGVSAASGGAGKVAYLTKRFPRLSETFILDEIIGLEQAGVPLRLYAVAHPGEGLVQPDVSKVSSGVTYLRARGRFRIPVGIATSVGAHAALAVRDPRRYRIGLAAAISERSRSGTIRPFIDAGRLASKATKDGTTHVHAAFAHGPASTARFVHLLTGIPFSFAAHAKDLYLSDQEGLAEKFADAKFVLTCSAAAAAGISERVYPSNLGCVPADVIETGDMAPRAGDSAESEQIGEEQIGEVSKLVLAYHGVDIDRFRPESTQRKAIIEPSMDMDGPERAVSENAVRILAVGRLVPKKGYPVLLRALSLLRDGGTDLHCRIVGGGDLKESLGELITELGLDGVVELVGARTHQQIAEEYRSADIFVQSSVLLEDGDRDGIPNSLLEAMASGLTVVASSVSGIPEAVEHNQCGLLAEPGNPIDLAEKLSRVIGDPALAAELSDSARRRIEEQFDRKVCAAKVASLFGRAPSKPAPSLVSGR